MIDFTTVQTAYYLVAATGVLVAAGYYILNMRATQRNMKQTLEARRIGMIQTIVSQVMSEDGMKKFYELMNYEWRDYDDFERKYGSDFNVEATAKRFNVWTTYNSIGLMLRKGFIEAEDLYDLGMTDAWVFWVKYRPIIEENRRRYNGTHYLKDFEYLAGEMLRVVKKWDPAYVLPATLTKYVPDK